MLQQKEQAFVIRKHKSVGQADETMTLSCDDCDSCTSRLPTGV